MTPQSFEVSDDITVLVGMNESGKTATLKAIGKSNYFEQSKDFDVDLTTDYPEKYLNRFKGSTSLYGLSFRVL